MTDESINTVELIKSQWVKCENENVEVFRYKLNVTGERILDGKFKFLIEVRENKKKYE